MIVYFLSKLPENEEQSDECEEEGGQPPAAFIETKFCDWCCSYFAQSVTKVCEFIDTLYCVSLYYTIHYAILTYDLCLLYKIHARNWSKSITCVLLPGNNVFYGKRALFI